jgi:hypothetical protein
MTDAQVFEYIRKRWEARASWSEIAKELDKKGHVSARTGRPLQAGACRTIYYNFEKKPAIPKNQLKAKVEALRSVLKLQANADTKLKLIEQMLQTLDT